MAVGLCGMGHGLGKGSQTLSRCLGPRKGTAGRAMATRPPMRIGVRAGGGALHGQVEEAAADAA